MTLRIIFRAITWKKIFAKIVVKKVNFHADGAIQLTIALKIAGHNLSNSITQNKCDPKYRSKTQTSSSNRNSIKTIFQ